MKAPAAGTACLILCAALAARATDLRPPSDFAGIADESARSKALFAEIAKVIQSPRCLNCHPATRQPTQGDDLHAHMPPMHAGPAGVGEAGLPCRTCHGESNVATADSTVASIPGNPRWRLAPLSMAWQGKSSGEICEQLKDRERNGGRNVAELREHMGGDDLVGWAWHPGEGRAPAPGTQQQLGELVAAWVSSGAQCPPAH